MLRRLAPILLILAGVVLDTTVLPIAYTGVYAVPLTLVVVLLIGMLLGRMRGLLYGTLGGLLIDITAGTLGAMTFYFMGAGFLIGLILFTPGDLRPNRRYARRRLLRRAGWVFALCLLGELVILVFQYFHTANFMWIYILNIVARALLCTALTLLLRPLFYAMLVNRRRGASPIRNKEVRSF